MRTPYGYSPDDSSHASDESVKYGQHTNPYAAPTTNPYAAASTSQEQAAEQSVVEGHAVPEPPAAATSAESSAEQQATEYPAEESSPTSSSPLAPTHPTEAAFPASATSDPNNAPEHTQPGAQYGQSASYYGQPSTQHGQPENQAGAPYPHATNQNTQTGAAYTQPGAAYTQPGAPYTQPNTQYTQPGAQYAQPGFGTSQQQPHSVNYALQPEPDPGTNFSHDLSKSLSWALSAFGKHWVALVVPSAIWFATSIALFFIAMLLWFLLGIGAAESTSYDAAQNSSYGAGVIFGLGTLVCSILMFAALYLPMLLWVSGNARAASMIAKGKTPTIMQGMWGGKQLLTAFIVGILGVIGIFIPPLIGCLAVSFFFSYALYLSEIDNLGLIDSLKASAKTAIKNPGLTIVLMLIVAGVSSFAGATIVGSLAVVALMPFTGLAMSAAYLRINNRKPAPIQ